jgi:hypothetical protein
MRHQCTVCLRAFVDDSGIPETGRVHCVYCGAVIAASRKRRRQDRAAAVPFSKDAEREETFALGIIGSGPVGFPDTLRQFRVRPTRGERSGDTLMPVAHGAEQPLPNEEVRPGVWRMKSFWFSLGAGLLAGIALASAATSPTPARPAAAISAAQLPARRVASAPATAPVAPAPVVLPVPSAAPVAAAAPALPKVTATPKAFGPVIDQRSLVDLARARQREYRLTEAERLYRRVLEGKPRDSEALAGLGEVDVLRGTTASADEHFQAALRVNGDYIPALIAVADMKWESGRFEQARQAYRSIVESYSADLYPPYVAQRSTSLLPTECGEQ